jgi:protein O-GlcNAc transferase
VYANRREIDAWRRRVARGMTALERTTTLRTAGAKAAALEAIGYDTNFYLAYQGRNDRALQRRYGRLVCRVMSANYPQYTRRRPMPGARRGRIRVGYVSAFMRHHAVANSHLGWLRHADRNRFAIHAYHLGPTTDAVTDEFRRCSDTFHHIPERLDDLCAQATGDNLHLLVHLDIGMFPRSTQLAGLRLAPVQCTTWGHPVTSGLRTIDYFISSDLMEPVHADRHYTERLIRLPNLGIAYMKPERPRDPKSRQAFGIREDATVFLCCQSPFKYLPQYDQVLVRIARRVPGSQFVFVAPPPLGTVLQQRLARAFTRAGLDADCALLFLTGQSWPDYLSLMLASDVFLDTFEWSGCNTALEALALGLPVVTCPGRYLRGRHGYAFLMRMGLTDTLAPTQTAFVEIAVRLGLDAQWRRDVVERLASRVDSLYEDREPVIALERFYSAVVAAR